MYTVTFTDKDGNSVSYNAMTKEQAEQIAKEYASDYPDSTVTITGSSPQVAQVEQAVSAESEIVETRSSTRSIKPNVPRKYIGPDKVLYINPKQIPNHPVGASFGPVSGGIQSLVRHNPGNYYVVLYSPTKTAWGKHVIAAGFQGNAKWYNPYMSALIAARRMAGWTGWGWKEYLITPDNKVIQIKFTNKLPAKITAKEDYVNTVKELKKVLPSYTPRAPNITNRAFIEHERFIEHEGAIQSNRTYKVVFTDENGSSVYNALTLQEAEEIAANLRKEYPGNKVYIVKPQDEIDRVIFNSVTSEPPKMPKTSTKRPIQNTGTQKSTQEESNETSDIADQGLALDGALKRAADEQNQGLAALIGLLDGALHRAADEHVRELTIKNPPEANPAYLPHKGVIGNWENKLNEMNFKLEQEVASDRKIKNPAERAIASLTTVAKATALGMAEFGVGTVKLLSDAVHNPVKAGEEVLSGFIGNPFETATDRAIYESVHFANPSPLTSAVTQAALAVKNSGLAKATEAAVQQFKEGNPIPADELAGNLAAGFAAGELIRASGLPEYAPKPEFAQVVSIGGDVEEPKVEPVRYGVTISALKKPVLTVAKTDEGWRAALGAVPAPSEAIEGRIITAFSPVETEFFKETIKNHAEEPVSELFDTGYNIANRIYKTKQPVTNPDEFLILSSHIPDEAKEPVKEAIKSYKGDLEVYGSVAQKLQMQGFMSREPKDIEVKVDNPEKFVNKLKSLLDSSGVQYRIEEDEEKPKVYFKTEEGWVKGIEIFKKGTKPFSENSPYSPDYPIQYGFKDQKPISVEGVDMMRLSEQAARKLAGGHVYSAEDMDVIPVHEGRWKDVNDLIEIGTAYAKGKGLPIEEDVVKYTELQKELHPDKVNSPVADFIVKHGRLPEPDELRDLIGDVEVEEKELLFKKEKPSNVVKELSPPADDIGYSLIAGEHSILADLSPSPVPSSPGSLLPGSIPGWSVPSHISSHISKPDEVPSVPSISSASWPSWPPSWPPWPSWPSWKPGSGPSPGSGSGSTGPSSPPSIPSFPTVPSTPSSGPPSKPSTPSPTPSPPSTNPTTPSVPKYETTKRETPIILPKMRNTKRKQKTKLVQLKDWKIKTDVAPLADWWAMTYTQAIVGLKARSPYRFDAERQWKQDLTKFGFGLTFPTRFIQRYRIRSYLDNTIKKAGELDIVTGKRAKKKINKSKKLKIPEKDVKIGFGSGKKIVR